MQGVVVKRQTCTQGGEGEGQALEFDYIVMVEDEYLLLAFSAKKFILFANFLARK